MDNIYFIKQKGISLYIIITSILIFSLLILASTLEYEEYLNYYGEVNNDYIVVLIEKENLSKISNKLLVNNEKKCCEIDKISRNYIVNTDYKLYHEVYFKCDIKIDNSYILDIKISKGNTTILKKIKEQF